MPENGILGINREEIMIRITRRQAIGGLAAVATLPATRLFAQSKLALPTSPVTLNVVDVAGNLALTQKAIENYRQGETEAGFQDHLHQGAGAGTARQDQGAAGRQPRRHRRRAHRHRRVVGRRRPEALDPARCPTMLRSCRSSTTSIWPAQRKCRRCGKDQGVVRHLSTRPAR